MAALDPHGARRHRRTEQCSPRPARVPVSDAPSGHVWGVWMTRWLEIASHLVRQVGNLLRGTWFSPLEGDPVAPAAVPLLQGAGQSRAFMLGDFGEVLAGGTERTNVGRAHGV